MFLLMKWHEDVLLVTSLLAMSALLVLWIYDFEKKYLQIFVFIGLGGFIAEAIVVVGGAWTYHTQHFLGLPIWLPIIWGTSAVSIARLAERLNKY